MKGVLDDMKLLLNGDLSMRLHNIYYICQSALNGMKQITNESLENGAIRLTGWDIGKQALESLFNIDFIKDDAQKLYNILNPMDREKTCPDIGNLLLINLLNYTKNLYSNWKV